MSDRPIITYPHIFVSVDDISTRAIIERADRALKKADIPPRKLQEFREWIPRGHAAVVAYIREWVDTD